MNDRISEVGKVFFRPVCAKSECIACGEVSYLKALSMVRNVAHQKGEKIASFTTAVFDLVQLPENWRDGPPNKDHPLYYYRPWKTILHHTVAEGGQSYYIQGDFKQTIPTLWQRLTEANKE